MMTKTINATLALSLAACVALPTTDAYAQTDGSQSSVALEEIIVSARKRSESLQEVPISVDVFVAERIDQLSIRNVADIAAHSSGLTFDQGVMPSDTRPVIRGVASPRGRPNVGILIDSVDVSSEALTVGGGGITANLRLLDLERVEILKGPQNALYGRSAFTGAINYVTKRPSDTFESEVSVDYDEHQQSELRYSISGPLWGDNLRGRAIISQYDSDGFYENPNTGGDLGGSESLGGAVGLEWDITDDVSTYLRVEYSDDEFGQRPEVHISTINPISAPANFIGTGTITDDALMVPHTDFDSAVCNTIDRIQPYYDSFGIPGAQPCRPLVVGKLSGDESMIDLSPDPRTGKDFFGSQVETARVYFDVAFNFDNDVELKYILGYLNSDAHMQLDFDRTNHEIVSSFVPFPPPGMATSQYGLSSMGEQTVDTEQWNYEMRLSGGGERAQWHLSLLHWKEEMHMDQHDEWYLREGGNPAPVLGVLNDTVFSFLNEPVPPFFNNFCDLVYPGNPNCVPMVTHLQSTLGDTPPIFINRQTKHTSVAGLVSFAVTDNFAVTLEGRLIDETIDYEGVVDDIAFSGQFGDDPWWGFQFRTGETSMNTIEENKFIPKVTLDWTVADNVLLYGYYAQAFKPGGVSTTDSNGDVSDGEYRPEELDVWEIGIKSEFRDRSIRWNASAYFYDYTDQQVPFQFLSPTTGRFQTSVINAAETEVTGWETDLLWNSMFLEGLSVQLGYTFTDAEYTDFNLAEILAPFGGTPSAFNRAKAGNEDGDFTGNTPPMTVEHAATGSVRYDMAFSNGMSSYIEWLGRYQSEREIGEGNWASLPSYTLHDLYAGLASDSWALTLYVLNLADDDTVRSGIGNVDFSLLPDGRSLPQAHQVYLPQPRTFGARLQVFFGD